MMVVASGGGRQVGAMKSEVNWWIKAIISGI